MLEKLVLYTLSVTYLTHILLLSHQTGLLSSKQSTVLYPDGIVRQVNLFDRFRRLFGAYSISGYVWEVKPDNQLWRCPYCLSFWINLFLLPVLLNFIDTYYFLFLLLSVPYVAGRLNE